MVPIDNFLEKSCVEVLQQSLSDCFPPAAGRQDDNDYFFRVERRPITDMRRPERGPSRRWLNRRSVWQEVQRSLT